MGAALAGCSNSSRFDTPYGGGRQTQAQARPHSFETTGSIAARPAPTTRVTSQALPSVSAPATVSSHSGGYSSGAQGLGAYRPAASINSNNEYTGSIAQPAAPAGHWTWDGGQPVTVGAGETVETIARKHGVPASAIYETNGMTPASAMRPGQRLVIPRYVTSSAPQAAAPQMAAPARAPAYVPAQTAAAGAENVHVVAPGESLIGIARRYGTTLGTLAKLNNIQPYTKVNIGDRITVPGYRRTAAVAPRPQVTRPAPQPALPQVAAPVEQPRPAQPRVIAIDKASSMPAQTARIATPEPVKTETVVASAEPTGAMPSFRWPVHGRVISGFGAKANGTQNDGINLAVPEGTPVKAAEDGVVAYAGNELKGYGNLVLVRHANGYVSAYANAKELLVKRGDTIKRGQVIAHAGQTGNVTSPQLHFEIRKGSTPVDPTKYLSGT
jgi:murein DD-endopeptidase MepM/ murein hydrolase activator NlpD